jgi:hypothetical protein
MANTKTIIIVSLSVLTIGGVAAYLYFKNKPKKDEEGTSVGGETSTTNTGAIPIGKNTSTPPPSSISQDFPLMRGAKNSSVKRLQEALIGYYGISILPKYGADSDYGSELAAAVQKHFGRPDNISYYNLTYLEQQVKNKKLGATVPFKF